MSVPYNNSVHNYCTLGAKNFNVNFRINNRFGYSTFHFKSIILWNSLRVTLRNINSINTFQNNLKVWSICQREWNYFCLASINFYRLDLRP